MASTVQPKPTMIEHIIDSATPFKPVKTDYYEKGNTLSTQAQKAQEVWGQQKASIYDDDPKEMKQEKLLAEKILATIKPNADGRVRVDKTTEWPHAFHAQLTLKFQGKSKKKIYGGSGAMVGPHHLLTCGHNVYDPKKKRWAEKITVYPALNESFAPFGKVNVVKIFTFKEWTDHGDKLYDIALVILNRSIGKVTGWGGMLCTSDEDLSQETVNIVGYPGDKGMKQMWGMDHKIHKINAEEFEYLIDTNAGQSGSAIWINKFGTPMILGVHTLGGNFANYGVRLSQQKFRAIVQKIFETYCIEELPTRNWKAEPKVRTIQVSEGMGAFTLELRDGAVINGIALADGTVKLRTRSGEFFTTLKGHTNQVKVLIELKNGCIATGSTDNHIKIWSRNGVCIQTFYGHFRPVTSLVQLKDGNLASGSDDEMILIWKVDQTRFETVKKNPDGLSSCTLTDLQQSATHLLHTLKGHSGGIQTLIELRDGTLASGARDKTIRLWNSTGTLLKTFNGHALSVQVIIQLKDGTIASGSQDETVKFWSLEGACLKTFEGHKKGVRSLLELKDGTIACGAGDASIRLWTRQGICLKTLMGHEGQIVVCLELKDESLLSVGSLDKTMKLWTFPMTSNGASTVARPSLKSSITQIPATAQQKPISFIARQGAVPASPGSSPKPATPTTALTSTQGSSFVPNWRAEPTKKTIVGKVDENSLFIELNDGTFASGLADTIIIWNRTGIIQKIIKSLKGHTGDVCTLIELRDGTLASGSKDKTIKLWNRDGICTQTLVGHTSTVSALLQLEDGSIVSGSHDATIKIWDLDGTCQASLTGHTKAVDAIIELNNGILVSKAPFEIKIWSRSGVCLTTIEAPSTTAIAALKDGTFMLALDKDIEILRTDGTFVKLLVRGNSLLGYDTDSEAHKRSVNSLRELQDGSIASGSDDMTIKLWDRDGNCLQTLPGNKCSVKSLRSLKDGSLACGFSDKTISIYTFPPEPARNNSLEKAPTYGSLTKERTTISPRVMTQLSNGNFAAGFWDTTIRLWTNDGVLLRTLEGHRGVILQLKVLKDGSIASLSYGEIKLWTQNGDYIATIKDQTDCFIELQDQTIVTGSSDKSIKIWSRDGICVQTLEGHVSQVTSLIELRNGSIVSASANYVKVWKRDGKCLKSLSHVGGIPKLLALENGDFVTTTAQPSVKLFDADGNEKINAMGFDGRIDAFILLKDGSMAVYSHDKEVSSSENQVFLLGPNLRTLTTLKGHPRRVTAFAELDDGTLATGSEDKTIKLWKRDGTFLKNLEGHTGKITFLQKLKNGTIVSGSEDKTVKFWNKDGACIKTLEVSDPDSNTFLELSSGSFVCGNHLCSSI